METFNKNKKIKPTQDNKLPLVTCRLCGEKGRVKQIEFGQKHCTNCGNCW